MFSITGQNLNGKQSSVSAQSADKLPQVPAFANVSSEQKRRVSGNGDGDGLQTD